MAKNLVENSNKIVINIDPEMNPLKLNPNCILPVCGVGQRLPFSSKKFAGVHIRAALHHASLDLSDCLGEIHRVLDTDGFVFIQEPVSSNLLSRIARKLFPTEKHDPNECPFDPKHLVNNVAESFDIISIKYHFITCYLFPHIVARMPFKFFWRWVAYSLFQIDKLLLSTLPVIRSRAAYIEIIGVKKIMRNRYGSIVKILDDVSVFTKHKNLKIAIFRAIFTGFGIAGKIIKQHSRELSKDFKVAAYILDADMDSPNHVMSEVIWHSKNILPHMIYMLLFPLNFILSIRYNRLFRNRNPTITEIKKVK